MAFQAGKIIFLYVCLSVVSVAITFTLSLLSGHLASLPPYLGHLGDRPLESTVFTQVFVGDAAVLVLVIHLRFVYVSHCLSRDPALRRKVFLNTVGVCIGHLAALGLFVLACFQLSNAFYVHSLAFFIFLLGSVIYFVTQTLLSGALKAGKSTLWARVFLNLGMVVLFIAFVAGYAIPSQDVAYVFSATSQWFLMIFFQLYFLSYVKEFQQVMVTKTRIIVLPKEEWTDPRPVNT